MIIGKEQSQQIARDDDETESLRTALQAAQTHLLRSANLASLGRLTAGMAHEINNPVGFIMSNLGTLKAYSEVMAELIRGYRNFTATTKVDPGGALAAIRQLEQSEDIDYILNDLTELVAESREGARRIGDIVQGLKNFSHVDDSELTNTDLHQAIDATLNVVANETKYHCEITRQYGELPLVPCRLAQLSRALINLLINAAQSIDDQGTIALTTHRDGDFAVVEIQDTGSGIPQDDIGSIFDPFFTTKPDASGLGLSMSYEIIRDHGGTIGVESEVGVGTTFMIRLPIELTENGTA